MHIMHMCITHAASHACCRNTRLRLLIALLLDIAQFAISSRDLADLGRGADSDVEANPTFVSKLLTLVGWELNK
jgi:hypothetical protein